MAAHVQSVISSLKPGMRLMPEELLPRIPKQFLEENYVSSSSLMASLMVHIRKLDKEEMILLLPTGDFIVQKKTAAVHDVHVNRTRLACLHMRDAFLNGVSYSVMILEAPQNLISLYEGVDGLRRGIDSIALRITRMSDPEFTSFYKNLDDTTLTDSPLKGLG